MSGRLKTSIALFSWQSWGGAVRPLGSHGRGELALSQEEIERTRTFASLAAESSSCLHCCWNSVENRSFCEAKRHLGTFSWIWMKALSLNSFQWGENAYTWLLIEQLNFIKQSVFRPDAISTIGFQCLGIWWQVDSEYSSDLLQNRGK